MIPVPSQLSSAFCVMFVNTRTAIAFSAPEAEIEDAPAREEPPAKAESSRATSRIVARRSRSFASIFRTRASSSRGTAGLSRVSEGGSAWSSASMTATVFAPSNGRRPARSSQSSTPSEKTSVRASTSRPRACSGDMYATVPSTAPGAERVGSTPIGLQVLLPSPGTGRNAARPKSRTFTCPLPSTMTLPGLMSRWTTPRACAAARASATCRTISTVSGTSGARSLRNAESVRPATYSIAMKLCLRPSRSTVSTS